MILRKRLTKFRLPPDLIDLLRADAAARNGEEEMEDCYENISEISSSPTSIATDAMPPHVASFFEHFNVKERQEIVCYFVFMGGRQDCNNTKSPTSKCWHNL